MILIQELRCFLSKFLLPFAMKGSQQIYTQDFLIPLSLTLLAILVSGYALFYGFFKKKRILAEDTESKTLENYEVFLSFRGKDTRKGFTDHLYKGLVDAGIWVFRDDDELPVGETIGPELLGAIKRSQISIPILSEDYASSKWCLQELVQILECKTTANQIVLPVFYKVEPGDVRHLSGRFGKAFSLLQKEYRDDVVDRWKTALREVGSLKGWESEKIANGHEGELVQMVIRKVLTELKKAFLVVSEHLVGVEDHVENIMGVLDTNYNDVRVLGIHGMGGIGKTTLAKVIYNEICDHFDCCSFLADVCETSSQHKGLECLQKQLVSDLSKQKWVDISHMDEGVNIMKRRFRGKKVLILLDDVDDRAQLNALVGKREWFGLGSRLIITTRNKDVLMVPEVNLTYELTELNFDQSFILFCKHAFRQDFALGDHATLSGGIVSTTGGLPLAIEIIGSFLMGKSKLVWENTLEKLKKIPDKKVQEKLRISYEALDHEEKQIFLDIACFPIQTKRQLAVYMWTDCGFFPERGIEVLCLMSLVKIGQGDEIRMHDQLRDLGREIVREESYDEPSERSRLWNQEEALDVLEGMQGTRKVQALCLDFDGSSEENCFTSEQFKLLPKLRFLQMNHATLSGDFKHLFQELRWLQWEGCPSRFMLSNFHPRNLVILDLSHSEVTENWKGWNEIQLTKKLKVLRLEHCICLKMSPDMSGFLKLEILILEECENLETIHQSIGDVKTLVILNVRRCQKLRELPAEVGEMEELRELLVDETPIKMIPISKGSMRKLEILSASSCGSLVELPNSIGHLTSLSKLDLSKCENLSQIPESIGSLMNLNSLSLSFCNSLTKIPEAIVHLESLTKLDLSYSSISALPVSIGNLYMLEVLNVCCCPIENMPATIGKLRKLKELDASDCSSLQTDIPDEISGLSSLQHLQLQRSNISILPKCLYKLSSLQTLNLQGCYELRSLPELPSSLMVLYFPGDLMETLPNISNLTNLKHLKFADISERRNRVLSIGKLYKLETLKISISTVVVEDLAILSNLKKLKLYDVTISSLPAEIKVFYQLRELYVVNCKPLDHLPELPFGLEMLYVRGCQMLNKFPDLSNLKHLSQFGLHDCPELVEISVQGLESLYLLEVSECKKLFQLGGVGSLVSLWQLYLGYCEALEKLPDLSNLKNLTALYAMECKNLVQIQGLSGMKCLNCLDISECTSVEQIGDISGLKGLKMLKLENCMRLHAIEGIEKLTSLDRLFLSGCKSMENFPDLSKLRNLAELRVQNFKELVEIPGLKELKSLIRLSISGCNSIEDLPDFSIFTTLQYLEVKDCKKLKELRGLESMESLREIEISGCKLVVEYPDVSKLKNLEKLKVQGNKKLICISGIKELKSLTYLDISGCESIESLPDLSGLTKLGYLDVNSCRKLRGLQGIENLKKLWFVNISGCKSLEKKPNLHVGVLLDDDIGD